MIIIYIISKNNNSGGGGRFDDDDDVIFLKEEEEYILADFFHFQLVAEDLEAEEVLVVDLEASVEAEVLAEAVLLEDGRKS
jgi:hypothetical protein